MANLMPVYSVKNPPVSSCSASTRSNGGWLVSATAEITKSAAVDFKQNSSSEEVRQVVGAFWSNDPATASELRSRAALLLTWPVTSAQRAGELVRMGVDGLITENLTLSVADAS